MSKEIAMSKSNSILTIAGIILLFFVCNAILAGNAVGQKYEKTLPPTAEATQDLTVNPTGTAANHEEMRGRAGLARAVRKAARQARKNGKITAKQHRQIVILSVVHAESIEDALVFQMVGSGEDLSAVAEVDQNTGKIDRASIDWNALIDFIERMIPIILQLISLFGGGA